MTPLFDAHCHIDGTAASGKAPNAGPVRGRLLCGVAPVDWEAVRQAAAGWAGTVPAFGLHPWYAGIDVDDWPDRVEALLRADPDAWLGEAGLDALRTATASEQAQEEVFARQLRLAGRLGRKVNLHCVKAWERLVALLDAEYLNGGAGEFIVHSFSGPHQFIRKLAERGAYFSVGQLFSRHDSRRHRERVKRLPGDRLLLESDAILTPGVDAVDDLEHALAWLAAARDEDAKGLRERLAENSRRLFGAS